MTKEKPDTSIEDLFDEAEIISSYSDREAVEDGILFDVTELSKISPRIKGDQGPFRYVTANLAYSKGYLRDGETPSISNFIDLFKTIQEHMKRTGPDHFYSTNIEFPDGTRGTVYAVQNNTPGRYTILLPEDY